jgi:hypothetical protein
VAERRKLHATADNFSVDSVINARHQRISVTNLQNLASMLTNGGSYPHFPLARALASAVLPHQMCPLHLRPNLFFFASLNPSVQLSQFVGIPLKFISGWLRCPRVADSAENPPLPIKSTIALYSSPIGRLQSWGFSLQYCYFATSY